MREHDRERRCLRIATLLVHAPPACAALHARSQPLHRMPQLWHAACYLPHLRLRGFMKLQRWLVAVSLSFGLLPACGDDDSGGSDTPPEGACALGGTATGSRKSGCTACGKRHCDAELSDQSGSAWARQYFGGNGACAAFNACLCECLPATQNPIECATSACIGDMDAACQDAARSARECLNTHCRDECS
jgi:hypothetical protein